MSRDSAIVRQFKGDGDNFLMQPGDVLVMPCSKAGNYSLGIQRGTRATGDRHATGRSGYLQVGIGESGVRQSESEFEPRLDVILVEVTVVDEQPF